MVKPLAICIEDLDSRSGNKYMKCVALPGRQPGLRLDEDGRIVWQSQDRISCEFWVSADERLILYRLADKVPIILSRAGRSLDVPCSKPVVVLDKDRLDVGLRHLRIHIHGQAPIVLAPTPFVPKPRRLSRLAEVAATAVVIGAVATTGGCIEKTPEVVVIENPPEVVIPDSTPAGNIDDASEVCQRISAYRMGWVMSYADANEIVNELFHPDSPFQYTFWDDEAFRELVVSARIEGDAAIRAAIWQQAEDILINEHAAILPLFHYDRTGLIRVGIEYELAPLGAPHYMRWTLPEGRNTLRVHLNQHPILDPQTGTDLASQAMLNQLMEAPFRYTATGEIEPAGAESFEVSEDATTFTIHLRRDATWSDGEPVTAQHYVEGIIRLLRPNTASEYADLLYHISGAEPFNTAETDDPSTVGVTALDDYTLQITLDEPGSFFDSILAHFAMYPVRLDLIEQYGDEWANPENFVGNGPYTLIAEEHEHRPILVIGANSSYHSANQVNIRRVEYTVIAEDAAALAAFERGELDVSGYPAEEQARILEQMPEQLVRLPRPGTYYIGFNTRFAPTDNLNLRKALSSAVDRRAILDDTLEMPWRVEACGVIPPEIPGYRGCGEVGYEYDLEAAQAYLQAAMEEMDIDDPSEITVQLWFNHGNAEPIEAVAEMWETNLGIDVDMTHLEWGSYLENLDSCND